MVAFGAYRSGRFRARQTRCSGKSHCAGKRSAAHAAHAVATGRGASARPHADESMPAPVELDVGEVVRFAGCPESCCWGSSDSRSWQQPEGTQCAVACLSARYLAMIIGSSRPLSRRVVLAGMVRLRRNRRRSSHPAAASERYDKHRTRKTTGRHL